MKADLIIYIVIGILMVAVLALIVAVIRLASRKGGTNNDYIQTDIANLRRDVSTLTNELNKTLNERMDKTQSSMQYQLRQSSALIDEVSQRLTRLDETNKRVVDVADELKTLQNVLQNPKQRGVFGEFYLNSLLDNILAPNQWQAQYKFKDGEAVDAVIFLDKHRVLPIDSKFSLENYNRYVEAEDKDTKARYLAKVKMDLKGRIDETAKYIRPNEGTMDFAFMFIPSESLYYDLLISNVGATGVSRDLIEYAFRDKHVIITSPTSFMAYLETVLQGLRSLQIEEQAKEIQKRVAQLSMHLNRYDDYMKRLGNSLGTTVNHYNSAYKEFAKVDKDVIRITDNKNPQISPLEIDKPANLQ